MKEKLSKITATAILASMLIYTIPVAAFTKDETVYSNLKANGEEYKTIVTTHLENEEDEKILKDLTDLLNIENTSGDEKFSKDGESLIWEANSKDIYYKGETEKELPIEISVKYELDGKEVSVDEIKGKSGNVKISIEYKNKDAHTVLINEKEEKMYTPFVVACGTYINNENNKHIEVTNGKAIDDGSKTMVVGLAFPGMQASLNLDKNKLEIPEKIEITMESKKFEMSNIINFITPKIIEETDLEIFEDLNSIYSQVDTLKSASKAIQDGAKQLAEGTTTAKNGAEQISSEVNKAIQSLKADKSSALDEKTLSMIEEQAVQGSNLSEANKNLIIKSADAGINAQAKIIEEQYMENAKQIATATAIQTATTTAGEVATGVASIARNAVNTAANSAATNSANIAIEKSTQAITSIAIETAIAETIKQLETNGTTITDTLKSEIRNNITAQMSGTISSETIKQKVVGPVATGVMQEITKNVSTQLSDENVKKQVIAQINQAQVAQMAEAGVEAQRAEISKKGIESSKLIAETTAIKAAQEAATTAARATSRQVAAQVGNTVKSEATKQVITQMTTLNDGLNQLTSGLTQLDTGATTLAEGTQEFNKTGIEKICNYINNDVKELTTRAEKLYELSEKYNTFTILNNENKGRVKFITIIDSIKNDDKNNSKEKIEEKTSN